VHKGESLKHKLSKPQTFHKFNRVEKSLILLIVIATSFFVGSVASWQIQVANYNAHQNVDPWTTIWNGETYAPNGLDANPPGNPFFVQTAHGAGGMTCGGPSCLVSLTATNHDILIISIYGTYGKFGGAPSFTITDTAGSTYAGFWYITNTVGTTGNSYTVNAY